jgi:hypothetical protein
MAQRFFLLIGLLGTSLSSASEAHDATDAAIDEFLGVNTAEPEVLDLPTEPATCTASPVEEDSEAPKRDRKKRMVSLLQRWATRIPSLGPVVKDYAEMLGMDKYDDPSEIGGGNAGLVHWFDKQLDDKKFHAKAKAFYGEILAIDLSKGLEESGKGQRRPRLRESVWSRGLRPGWLWELAMKHADQDPKLALKLIGACGHDDVTLTAKLDYQRKLSGEERQERLKGEREYLDSEIVYYKVGLGLLPTPKGQESHVYSEETKAEFRKSLEEFETRLAALTIDEIPLTESRSLCPTSHSAFYLSQGLGGDVDLSLELKSRIVHAQHMNVAAKNYHIYAAASVACELLQRGHTPQQVATIEKFSAWAYRTVRINKDICMASQPTGVNPLEQDAATLMARQAVGGGRLRLGTRTIRMPQTNLRVRLPDWIEESRTVQSWRKPRGWSEERYQAARKKAASIWVDWDWTGAQHAVGTKFAIEHCSPGGRSR